MRKPSHCCTSTVSARRCATHFLRSSDNTGPLGQGWLTTPCKRSPRVPSTPWAHRRVPSHMESTMAGFQQTTSSAAGPTDAIAIAAVAIRRNMPAIAAPSAKIVGLGSGHAAGTPDAPYWWSRSMRAATSTYSAALSSALKRYASVGARVRRYDAKHWKNHFHCSRGSRNFKRIVECDSCELKCGLPLWFLYSE